MDKSRMEAFSDGVFAIAITILILELKIPVVSPDKIIVASINQLPKLLAFVLSFIIIGTYWVAHHSMVSFIKKVNRTVLWFNLLNLLFICFLPYPTGMLGEYPFNQFVICLYAISLSCVNITGTAFWLYSTSINENKAGIPGKTRKLVVIIHLSPIFFYLLSIGFTFVSMYVSYIIFLIVPLFFIFPNRFINRLLEHSNKD